MVPQVSGFNVAKRRLRWWAAGPGVCADSPGTNPVTPAVHFRRLRVHHGLDSTDSTQGNRYRVRVLPTPKTVLCRHDEVKSEIRSLRHWRELEKAYPGIQPPPDRPRSGCMCRLPQRPYRDLCSLAGRLRTFYRYASAPNPISSLNSGSWSVKCIDARGPVSWFKAMSRWAGCGSAHTGHPGTSAEGTELATPPLPPGASTVYPFGMLPRIDMLPRTICCRATIC